MGRIRRWLLSLAALGLASGGALAWMFSAATLPLSPLPAFSPPVAQPPPAMRIAALVTGENRAPAAITYRGGSFGDQRAMCTGGILVQHPRGSLLFDAGYGKRVREHVKTLPWVLRNAIEFTEGKSVVDQLAAARIDPRSLMGVVLTHAHWDHTSGLEDLRGVPVMVTQAELDFIHSGDVATDLVRGFEDLPYRVYGFPNGPYLGYPHSYDVFGDGSVVIVPAGGHTPGSVIAFVTLPNAKRYALIGDIAWQAEGVSLPAERPLPVRMAVDHDPAGVRRELVHLHQLQQRIKDMTMVPAHDGRVWAKLPKLL
jgi:glyoxylase-like metal-dependent hydrolase (beta-lactamase superfamily II)